MKSSSLINEKQLDHKDLLFLHDTAAINFRELWAEMDKNEGYRKANNWTDTERTSIINQDRTPLSMPIAQAKLNSISGYQKKVRTEYKVKYSTDPNDAPKAEIATLVLKDIAKQSNFPWVESEMFDDALYVKFGCTEIYLDDECVPPMIKVRNVDYKNIIWDYNATKYDLSDALFMAKIDKIYRADLDRMYPKNDARGGDVSVFEGREKDDYYTGAKSDGGDAFEIVSLFTHYQTVHRDYYAVIFPDSMSIFGQGIVYEEFKSKKDAEQRLRELNWTYLANNLPPEGSVEKKVKRKLDKYRFTYDRMIEHEETELEDYPFTMFFSIFQKGRFISMMDYLKSPQLFYDRVIMQTDYALGKQLKNLYTLDLNLLAENESVHTVADKASKGGIVGVKSNTQEVIKQVISQGIPPQYFQMFNFLTSILEDTSGGRSFQGLSEGKNESGISVKQKKEQGELVAVNYLTNLSETKRIIGEKLLWWVKNFDKSERIIKVIGGELKPSMMQLLSSAGLYQQNPYMPTEGFVKVNSPDVALSWLKDANFELIVTEDEFSESQRDKNLMFSLEAAKVVPEITQTMKWREKVLFSLGYSFEDVQAILIELQQLQMAQAAQAAQSAQGTQGTQK